MYVVVSAAEHPVIDDWVREQAAAEAQTSDLKLGEYLGREREAFPADQLPPDMCCHVFSAAAGEP